MKTTVHVLIITGIALIAASLYHCASIGSPTGGPKDSIPPVLIQAVPPNYSVNFDKQKVSIYFNEYITLDNFQKTFIVSPLMEENPEVLVKGKRIVITLLEEPADSVTYTLNFGNTICDYHENNPYPDYMYAFSTKDFVDTLSVRGCVMNAFDMKPVESIYVMLYENLEDSAPCLEKPKYIAKTDAEGKYTIAFIKSGSYRIFALNDLNNNYLFDLPNETIAFVDSVIIPKARWIEFTDTIPMSKYLLDSISTDSIAVNSVSVDSIPMDSVLTDSFQRDTVITKRVIHFTPDSLRLVMFTEDHEVQYITEYTREEKWKLEFVFNRQLWHDSLDIRPVKGEFDSLWYMLEINEDKDSLVFWLTDSLMYNTDTLQLRFEYLKKDSSENLVNKVDSLYMVCKAGENEQTKQGNKGEKQGRGGKGGNNQNKGKDTGKEKGRGGFLRNRENNTEDTEMQTTDTLVDYLQLTTNVSNAGFDLNIPIWFTSPTPLKSFNETDIQLFEIIDSVEYKKSFEFGKADNHLRRYALKFPFEESTKYKLFVPPGTFTDIYDRGNDTIMYVFTTKSKDTYTKITIDLTYTDTTKNLIFQLLNESKEQVIKQLIIKGQEQKQRIVFDYIKATSYKLKAIVDENMNDKWDTGNYLKKQQPEKVLYFNKVFKTKANFEYEDKWKIDSRE